MKQLLIAAALLTGFIFSLSAQQDIKTSITNEVNKLRAKGCQCGDQYMAPAEPLTWNDKLEKAARVHANDMSGNKHFSHTGTDKSVVDDRAVRYGYTWSAVGENIARGHETVEEVVEAWKNSPSHCAILMDPEFTETGAAIDKRYWVMVFASPL